jgi:cytochrome c biogenesis protein CcmG/thiol:disulfide interchange protein DsbE
MRNVFAGSALLAVVLLAGCSKPVPVNAAGDLKMAPDFTLTDDAGKPVKLSSFKGKAVVLNFWATWCGPCKVEIPWFIEFQQTYRDKDLVILGVSYDDDGWKSVKPYMTEKKINYRILIGNDELAKAYGGLESLPTTVMIDKAGRIVATHIGLVSKSDYKAEIESLLKTNVQASNPITVASDARVRAD